ncbi:MAG: hypothetical protein GXO57_01925 [Thermodesulfobacteria bacterium]|nr:hypothetical protein [Thermodesulfobacteriota bacterium]
MKLGKVRKLVGLTLAGVMCLSASAFAGETVTAKSSDVNWKLYGRVKVDFNYDTAKFTKYNDFIGAVANGAKDSDWKNDSTNFNPRDTRLGAIVSTDSQDWKTTGRIEIDFYGTTEGDNLIPRMRLGYIDLFYKKTKTDIRIGQDWIPVAQLNPSTVDFGILSAAGNLWWRMPQITVRQNYGNWQILGSVMRRHRSDVGTNVRMPWLLARLQYKGGVLGSDNMVAIGGGYRKDEVTRWLIAGEYKFGFKLADLKFKVKGELWTGKGIGAEFLRYDLDVNSVTGKAIKAYGGWADITCYLTKKISVTAGAGIDNPKDSDMMAGRTVASLNDRQFTKNTIYYVNAWYKLTNHVKLGAEIMRVETERDTITNKGTRYTLSAFYNF